MNVNILHKDVQHYINSNLKSDITKLLFKGSPFDDITAQELAIQIDAKRRCEKKLPTWYHAKSIYFPKKVHIEQASSERAAAYKSQLLSGESIIDITGGLGVDCYFFAKGFRLTPVWW